MFHKLVSRLRPVYLQKPLRVISNVEWKPCNTSQQYYSSGVYDKPATLDAFAPFPVQPVSDVVDKHERIVHNYKTQTGTENSQNHDDNKITQRIMAAENAQAVFDSIPSRGNMSLNQILDTFQSLFHLRKTNSLLMRTEDIITHPKFKILCTRLKYVSSKLNENNIIQLIKICNLLKVDSNAEIFAVLLDSIRCHASELKLDQIMFLDFLLAKQSKVPIVQSFQFALPIMFQMRVVNDMDHQNLPQLLDYLSYAANNADAMGRKPISNIVSGIALNSNDLNAVEAMQIIWKLTKFKQFEPIFKVLLDNCNRILTNSIDEISIKDLQRLLWRVTDSVIINDAFYSEVFFDRVLEKIVEHDIGLSDALSLISNLRRINYVSEPLFHYVAEQISQNPDAIAKAPGFVIQSLVSAFADSTFIPPNWESVVLPAIERNDFLFKSSGIENQWLRFFAELNILNYTDLAFVKRILSKEYLDKYFEKDVKPLAYLSLLNLYQAVASRKVNPLKYVDCADHISKAIDIQSRTIKYELRHDLESVFGSEQVLSGIYTKYGHFIPNIVVQKKKSGEFVNLSTFNIPNEKGFIELDDITCNDDEQIIAINYWTSKHYIRNKPQLKGPFLSKQKQLNEMGLDIVSISEMEWKQKQENEIHAFLIEKIVYRNALSNE